MQARGQLRIKGRIQRKQVQAQLRPVRPLRSLSFMVAQVACGGATEDFFSYVPEMRPLSAQRIHIESVFAGRSFKADDASIQGGYYEGCGSLRQGFVWGALSKRVRVTGRLGSAR